LTEPLQVGQFAIVDHEPVDRGPNAGVFRGKGPTDDRAELFILAEGTTPAGEAFAGHVVSAIGQAFATLDMSLTGSLRRLFGEAAKNVDDWNRKSIVQHRVSLGLSCFGRRGDQAVLAQAGPSVAFHLRKGRVTAYAPEGEHARPIGAAPVEPQMTRLDFGPGDRLLLISTSALEELDDELIAGIVSLPREQVLPDLYHRVQQVRHLTVVLVTGPDSPARPALHHPPAGGEALAGPPGDDFVIDATDGRRGDGPPHPEDEGYQPGLFIAEPGDDAGQARQQLREVTPRPEIASAVVELAAAPAPLLRVAGESAGSFARIAAEGQARAERSRAAASAQALPHAGAPAGRTPWQGAHVAATNGLHENGNRRSTRNTSFTRGLVTPGTPQVSHELPDPSIPMLDDLAGDARQRPGTFAPAAETIAGGEHSAVRSGGSLVRVRSRMGGRWKGAGNVDRHPAAMGMKLPPTWMVILAGLGVLLVLVGFVTVPSMLEGDNGEEYSQLLDGAARQLANAQVIADPTEKRDALVSAQAMLLKARETDSGDARADGLLAEVTSSLATMDHVLAPASVAPLASLDRFGEKPVAVVRMAVGEGAAYVLDANAMQVVEIGLADGAGRAIFAEDKEASQAAPVALATMDSGPSGPAQLLVADAANHLWAYTDGTLTALAFNAPSGMAVTDIAVHEQDLYVLDAPNQAVYRFPRTDEGFPIPPVTVVDTDELREARRVAADGEIFTADADGTVHRYISGEVALTLAQAGIDRPLVAPESAQLLGEDEVAFLDGANDRIVVFRRDGTFDRQYRDPAFDAAGAFVVRDGRAFIFSGAELREITW